MDKVGWSGICGWQGGSLPSATAGERIAGNSVL